MMKLMAMVVAVLPAAVGLAGGARLDISGDVARQTVIAEGGRTLPEGYQGHPTTVLTQEGKLICVWTLGHGGPCGPAAESTDGGRTWTRIDERFPKVYRATHKNCPILQKCVRRNGGERLFVFSAKHKGDPNAKTNYFRLGTMLSDDGGKSWREGRVADLSSTMPPTGFMQLKDGSLALFGQVRLDRMVKTDNPKDDQGIWMSVSRDDGETWSPMRVVAQAKERNLCEPCCLRSPDGKTLALIMRENRHTDCSMVCLSSDEGQTWTKPVLTAPELTGDRHEGVMLDDGRYLICFRDRMLNSPTAGQFVGWVGSWRDLTNARPGDLRIRLLNHRGKHGVWPGNEWDTGYSGVEKLADGTILCTTYTKHFDDDRYSSVVATRLYPSDFVVVATAGTVADSRPLAGCPQYWTPAGANTWVGDVAVGTHKGRLHVFYLKDHNHHGSAAHGGCHCFAHLSAREDLTDWVEHCDAVPLTAWWQTLGTGTPFIKDGKLCLAYGYHTERVPDWKKLHLPAGATWAESEDGVHFKPSGVIFHETRNPTVFNRPDGRFGLVLGYNGMGGLYVSDDLLKWEVVDANLPGRGDCPCYFIWNGHHYLLQSFTQMFHSPSGKPGTWEEWSKTRRDIYEGLSVPMVCEIAGGRRIMGGWLSHPHGWGGWLVFRELKQNADGTLGTVWPKDLATPVKTPDVYRFKAGENARIAYRTVQLHRPLLLVIDAKKGTAAWSQGGKSEATPCSGGDFTIEHVTGLDRPYEVKVAVWYDERHDTTIFDAEIAGARTLITRRFSKYEKGE